MGPKRPQKSEFQNPEMEKPLKTLLFSRVFRDLGGDGGSRTHVRKQSAARIYMCSLCLRLSYRRP